MAAESMLSPAGLGQAVKSNVARKSVIRWAPIASAARAIVFFFQAEDGIRDVAVTGVQTCALPICVEMAAIGAFDDMAVEEAVGLDPLPLRILGGLSRLQAHQPVTGAAAGEDHRADRKSVV